MPDSLDPIPPRQPMPTPTAAEIKDTAEALTEMLRLRTLPFGMKLFEDAAEMDKVPGLRKPGQGLHFTTCQLVTQVRTAGFTLGVVRDNLRPNASCGANIGLEPVPEGLASGEHMTGVWFENREAAAAHQAQMPRVPAGRYSGLCASPLRSGRLDPPDICLFYATPGQMILFVNGLQYRSYKRYDFTITGESACADSWGRALSTRETSLSIPCYAERRYGGVADDELLMACPPDEFVRGVDGLKALAKNGLRYPYPPYGAFADPAAGMSKSYG
ncbi:hypothetical protein GCM10017083_13990 [Thalassobaculum fulvum]|uniref:DUF169 domain-containing protein n=1 Tax=Thalassobaculum fulvum TaxID=1633335 RepID=A0A919CNU2_9PROT|nr:DUF169 domain-containing protein [Thalassobaculum fulvum]GHD45695.1 hypothetical protein GCM10017083_13990 [Thalassobaculum fulvum]